MSEQTSSEERTVTTECGHETPESEVFHIPGGGDFCRTCHHPFALNEWDDIINERRIRRVREGVALYQTWLVGLDEVGRAVYYEEYENRMSIVVPKHHRAFREDVSGDERPLRKSTPRHDPSRGDIINAPDGDVLIRYDTINTESGLRKRTYLTKTIIERASRDDWNALTDRALRQIRVLTDKYENSQYYDDFPVEKGREVLEAFGPLDD